MHNPVVSIDIMNSVILSILMFCLITETLENQNISVNNRPIIGVLAQELSPGMKNHYPEYSSYIAASYVKYVEGAGGRVVPIRIGREQRYYKKIISSVNGILFPGGATYFNTSNGYAAAGAYLYDYAVKMNMKGIYFPIWGTCLGFELLTYISAGHNDLRCSCWSYNQAVPLNFKPGFRVSRLFGNAPGTILDDLANKPVAANFHQFCVTEKNMTKLGLTEEWNILSTNVDSNGLEFVSSFESWHFPFYGVQFHPEKNGYEWKSSKRIPHDSSAVEVMQYFANFFLNEARKNFNSFMDEEAESSALLYNYPVTYTGRNSSFEQCYFFV